MSKEVQDRIVMVCNEIRNMLVEKNQAYGNSFADPINIFSEVSPHEQLAVRIDDKLNRIKKGFEYGTEDTINDLIGYLILWNVLDES